jgi:hypothetical protein
MFVHAGVTCLLLSLACFAAVEVLRKLGPLATLTFDGVKPFACDACFSSWCALSASYFLASTLPHPTILWLRPWPLLLAPPAAGGCMFLLRLYGRMVPAPPSIATVGRMEDEDAED